MDLKPGIWYRFTLTDGEVIEAKFIYYKKSYEQLWLEDSEDGDIKIDISQIDKHVEIDSQTSER